MRRSAYVGRTLLVIALASCGAATAVAQPPSLDPPDVVRSFRVITSKSRVVKSGGFAGIHDEHFMRGTFDFVTGFEPSPLAVFPPIYVPVARFENVVIDTWWNHPAAFPPIVPLEEFVDLEALGGTWRREEPKRFLFRGRDADDQPFHMLGVLRGPLLHLVGESREPCCDFFDYKIDMLAHLSPFADFNLDGVIDRADAERIVANLGTATGAAFEQGDADGDGDVDGDDLLTWQQQIGFGVDLNELAADTLEDVELASAAVPEPSSLGLMLIGCIGLLHRRRC